MTREEMLDKAVRLFCERRWWGRDGRHGYGDRSPTSLIYHTKNGKATVNGPVCKSIRMWFKRVQEQEQRRQT